jgi:hypothetical protein
VISHQINDVAFRRHLSQEMHLHPVFRVSLLEPCVLSQVVPPPPPAQLVEGPEYEIDAILDSKIIRNKLYYLVDWVGYTPEDRTWRPAENVDNAVELVQTFHLRYPNKPNPSSCIMTRETRRQKRG